MQLKKEKDEQKIIQTKRRIFVENMDTGNLILLYALKKISNNMKGRINTGETQLKTVVGRLKEIQTHLLLSENQIETTRK